jgi:hypothetical protein
MVPEEGVARLSLRPSMAPAFAAGLGADALPCVALFFANRSAILARSTPSRCAPRNGKGGGAGGGGRTLTSLQTRDISSSTFRVESGA